jgi:chlorite dismutase
MAAPILANFVAGTTGAWRIERIAPVRGDALAAAPRLAVVEGADADLPMPAAWRLRGVTAHAQYTTRRETAALTAVQQGLDRPAARRAAMIPIRKSAAWWDLAQDERRAIFEDSSRHIAIGLDYLPAVARRLYHCRAFAEPFDFVTWFEYAPEHGDGFEELVGRLRATAEWRYVEREVDIRLSRVD